MLKAEILALCDQVIQDAATGKNTVVGIFDRITARQFPATHGRMTIFAILVGAPRQKVLCTIRIVGPSAHLIDLSPGEVILAPNGRANIVTNVQGVELPEPGDYRVIVLLNDTEIAETTLTVDLVQTVTGTPPVVH